MPIIRNRTIDLHLNPDVLFCNMNGNKAFRIIETYKNIRTGLVFTLSGGTDNTIVITSAEPNSGKSVTSANLGLSISQNGSKCLIIDCDMRNPSQQKIFEKENISGLSNILGGMCKFNDTVKRGVKENLDLLTAGQLPPNPSELLGSEAMKALLDEVKPQYDFIIMDCPPVGLVADTSALILNAPQVILIARQNHAVYVEVSKAVDMVKSIGGKILGAILTDVREGDKSYGYSYNSYRYKNYRYYSRYGYNRYYGYGNQGDGERHSHKTKEKKSKDK